MKVFEKLSEKNGEGYSNQLNFLNPEKKRFET